MTERLHQLAARVYNTPLLIHPDKALVIESVLRRWAAGDAPKPAALLDGEGGAGDGRRRVYRVTPGGTALIPVVGTLVHRGAWIGAYSGMTSYQGLSRQLAEARADDAVRAVMLDIDSPGGEAAGMFELSRMVRAVDAEKPVWAMANEGAFSAAYGLAAGGSRILAPESAMAGSIGVIALHMDESKRDEKEGVVYTPIYAGAHKADFSSHAPLADDARARIQALVDEHYRQFVALVSELRGLPAEAVRATEAGIFMAGEARGRGLIDGVATLSEAVAELEAETNGRNRVITHTRASARVTERSVAMSREREDVPADKPETSAATEADLTAAREAGIQAGVEQERARVAAILEHPEAEGRTELAHKAVATGLSVEHAAEMLAASPKSVPGVLTSLQGAGNPDLRPDTPDDVEPDSPQAIEASWDRAFGRA